MSRILVVDDEESICWSFREFLGDLGHDVTTAPTAEDALEAVASAPPDIVMLDVRLPGMDGLEALPKIQRSIGTAPIVVMTAFGDLQTAVRAVEAGAFDYLVKPFDLEQAGGVVQRALESVAISDSMPAGVSWPGDTLVGTSTPMQALFKRIALVAALDVPVLITGESGTGKELVARALQRYGNRRGGPFVPVCLPALSPSLVEAELFGHVRGAFTGASEDRKGLFELAEGGTVLLDEIGDVSLSLQVKLLRAIEHREITPVGSARPRPVDLRIVAATNRDLPALVKSGAFREDLYFRLAAFTIDLPPLRERLDDIPALASHFLTRCRGDGVAGAPLSREVLAALCSRSWPGNVRELRNAVEHAAILARGGMIRPEHLPAPPIDRTTAAETDSPLPGVIASWAVSALQAGANEEAKDLLERFLKTVEPPLLRTVLLHCAGNRVAAAKALGIDRSTLRQKLRRYGLD